MKSRYLILFIFLINLGKAYPAQTPGYLGKRLILSYNMKFSPALLNPAYKSMDISGIEIGLNNSHLFQCEYVLNRLFSLDFTFTTYRTKTDQTEYIESYYFEDLYSDDYTIRSGNVTLNSNLTGYGYGIGFKYYGKNIAPLGSYAGFGFFYMPYNLDVITHSDISDNESSNAHVYIDEDGYFTYGMNMEFGKHRIFFNRIITNFNMSFGYVFNSITDLRSIVLNKNNMAYYVSNKRLRGMTFFNISLGIGLLAF
jgi:hypothetical protein